MSIDFFEDLRPVISSILLRYNIEERGYKRRLNRAANSHFCLLIKSSTQTSNSIDTSLQQNEGFLQQDYVPPALVPGYLIAMGRSCGSRS